MSKENFNNNDDLFNDSNEEMTFSFSLGGDDFGDDDFPDEPFGLSWDEDIVKDFLQKRGYYVLNRQNKDGEDYSVAAKPEDSCIPTSESNLMNTFSREVQTILAAWLLKIGNNKVN